MNVYHSRKLFVIILAVTAALWFRQDCFAQQGNLKEDYDKLKKEYDALAADRDNILAQSKNMLQYKTKYAEMELSYKTKITDLENAIKQLESDKEQIKKELDALTEKSQMATKQSEEEINNLKQDSIDLKAGQEQLTREKQALSESIEKFKIEYKMLPQIKKELNEAKNDNKNILKKAEQTEAKFKQMEAQILDKNAQVEVYRRQTIDLKKKYEDAMVKNRLLEKKSQVLPAKFAEIARENKVLIKETALMHYNLGVFYTKNKEYSRAVAEFEKAIELNPDDPYALYNLGYIYAEYSVNRPKAIQYFRKFLSLAKHDDKDTDWVKKYILTWQTWEGKKPMD